MKSILLKIKTRHIRQGRKTRFTAGDLPFAQCCPVALALADAGFAHAYVTPGSIYFSNKTSCDQSATFERWIERFDSCKPIKPTTLRVNVPRI